MQMSLTNRASPDSSESELRDIARDVTQALIWTFMSDPAHTTLSPSAHRGKRIATVSHHERGYAGGLVHDQGQPIFYSA